MPSCTIRRTSESHHKKSAKIIREEQPKRIRVSTGKRRSKSPYIEEKHEDY